MISLYGGKLSKKAEILVLDWRKHRQNRSNLLNIERVRYFVALYEMTHRLKEKDEMYFQIYF